MQMVKMSKELMKERISEALKAGDEQEARRRVEVCMWGLDKVRGGAELANALIDELGLERYGQKKRPLPA
jgi:hypothetical protein